MKANKDTSTDASGKPAMAGKTEKPQGMSAMMAAMGKAPKEYSKEEVEFALAVAEVERTIKNVGNYKNDTSDKSGRGTEQSDRMP